MAAQRALKVAAQALNLRPTLGNMHRAVASAHCLAKLAVLLALGLAGCALTPEQAIEQGDRFTFESAHAPYSAAVCIGRNAKSRGGLSAEERLLGKADMEVVVRDSPGTGGDTLAVAQIRRGNPLSTVIIAVNRSVRDRQGFARQLMSGC